MKYIVSITLVFAALLAGCSSSNTAAAPEPEKSSGPQAAPLSIDMTGKEEIRLQNNGFEWDLDGDGTAEKFFVDVIDNGDEAPNVTEIGLQDGSFETLSIDGGYGIKEIAGIPDEKDRRMEVIYFSGTYDFSGNENRGYIRLMDGALVLENLPQ